MNGVTSDPCGSKRSPLGLEEGPESIKIVLLGKTGAGKSSLANTILGDQLFPVSHTINSETKRVEEKTKSVSGRNLTVIDTPGFFDTDRPEEELKPEIVRCITECAPGPHAFLIVLKVEKFTEHEQAVVQKICTYSSSDILKYAVVVFTHGDQLPDAMRIQEFVCQNRLVNELVNKCGSRCHIVDSKYWNNNPTEEYKSNRIQVESLLQTIDAMVTANNGSCYTNEMLREVEEEIKREEEKIRQMSGNLPEEEIREKAKLRVFEKLLIRCAGIATGTLLGAVFGVVVMVGAVVNALQDSEEPIQLRKAAAKTAVVTAGVALGVGGTAAGGGVVPAAATLAVAGLVATVGGVKGGLIGYEAAEGAKSPKEAAKRTLREVKSDAQSKLNKADSVWKKMLKPESKTPEREEEKCLLTSHKDL